jgi:uncharacterized membrane protein YhaH (DUF805 family)
MKENIILAVLMLAVLWLAISVSVYRFRHPGQSDTELFLNIGEAITFQK